MQLKYTVQVNNVQEMVYRTLRDRIVHMELLPGTVISTQEIADQLAVSRTPVREAFIRLQQEDLLTMAPQRYTMVSRIDLQRVHQECFIREALELGNLHRFVPLASQSTVNRMRESIKQQTIAMDERRFNDHVELDNQFHRIAFRETNERLALNLIRQMNGHYDRTRLVAIWEPENAYGAIEEHRIMVDLIEEKNLHAIEQLMRKHLGLLQVLEQDFLKRYPDYFCNG